MLIIELSSEKHALQNIQNDCYEGLSDSCRVHQIRFRPGLRPGPRWGSSRRSPRPLSRLWRGHTPFPFPTPSTPSASRSRRLRRLVLGAFGASFPKPPPNFFYGLRLFNLGEMSCFNQHNAVQSMNLNAISLAAVRTFTCVLS